MAPPDGIGLVCLECGASNRAGATRCFLCHHGLDPARPETRTGAPKSPTSPTDRELVNPYEPPTTFVSQALTFRISSLLMVIAVIAVCLGVWHEEPVLGIVLAVAVAPALGYTVFLAAKTKARGRPMAVFEKVDTFIAAIVGVVVIELSAFIAFFVTCFPIGLVAFAATGGINNKGTGITGVVVAVVIGGAAAIAAAYMTYRSLTRKGRHGG